jgi:hypothetical protein
MMSQAVAGFLDLLAEDLLSSAMVTAVSWQALSPATDSESEYSKFARSVGVSLPMPYGVLCVSLRSGSKLEIELSEVEGYSEIIDACSQIVDLVMEEGGVPWPLCRGHKNCSLDLVATIDSYAWSCEDHGHMVPLVGSTRYDPGVPGTRSGHYPQMYVDLDESDSKIVYINTLVRSSRSRFPVALDAKWREIRRHFYCALVIFLAISGSALFRTLPTWRRFLMVVEC